jgi:prolipoprotein diacylglyceryltransferase
MWPTLFSIGFFHVSPSWVVSVIGLLVAGFVFWGRGKEEHYSELQLFDGLLLSFVAGAIGARIGFILLHFSQFGWNLFSWLNIVEHPGKLDVVFLIVSTLYMYRFALRKKWDAFEVLDFWSLALTAWLFFTSIASFFAGTGRGKFTDLFVGMVFPGSIEKTHPVQLYFALFYVLLYFYLTWAESRYRIFEWYRMGKKSAQTGFLISTFIIFLSLFSALMLLFRLPEFVIGGWALDIWLYIFGVFFGFRLLLKRSDKTLFPRSAKERTVRAPEEGAPPQV